MKQEIKKQVLHRLEDGLESAISSYESARLDVHQAEGRMKTRYDSMRTESGFLADAQSKRVLELQKGLDSVRQFQLPTQTDRVVVGSLVFLEDDSQSRRMGYFLLPYGGGISIPHVPSITVVNPAAPISRLLLGNSLDDSVVVNNDEFFIYQIQ